MSGPAITIVNNQLSDTISVQDRGLFYGDGVFETLWFDGGDILLWQYHVERMTNGLHRLNISLDKERFKQHMSLLLSAINDGGLNRTAGIIKLIVTRGQGGRGYMPDDNGQATLVSYFYPLANHKLRQIQKYQQQGISVICCQTILPTSPLLAGLKTLNQLPYVIAAGELQAMDAQDGLLFDQSQHLIESVSRNIFLIKKGEILTPDLSDVGVAGVMRRFIIEHAAPALSITVKQVPLRKENLLAADEVFLANSISRLWPVINCDKTHWNIGVTTRLLQEKIEQILVSNLSCSLTNHFYE